MRHVRLYPGDDGQWVAECPSLPGAISQGATREEALSNIREAIDLLVETLDAEEDPVPADSLTAELVLVSFRRGMGSSCPSVRLCGFLLTDGCLPRLFAGVWR